MSMQITVGDDRDDDQVDDDLRPDDDDDRDDDDGKRNDRSRGRQPEATDDDPDDSDDDKSPEELRDEVKRLRAALQKSNSTGQRRRQQLKDLRAAQSAISESEDDDTDDDELKPKTQAGLDAKAVQRMVDKARKEERKAAEEQHRRDIIDTRVESALIGRGVDPKGVRLLLREVDYEDLDLLKDRSVDGLDEEMDRLQTEYPAMFRRGKAGSRRINGGDDREAGARRKSAMTATERQVAQLERAKRS